MKRESAVLDALRARMGEAPWVVGLGALGIALGVLCVLTGALRGFEVPPEGDLWETATFDGAVGVFVVTMALLVPDAGFGRKGRRWWTVALFGVTGYSYGIETVQAFRGLDPRFSAVAGATDQILGGVFFLTALGLMVLFVVLAWRYVRRRSTPLGLAVRYGAATALLAFAVGVGMTVIEGRTVGSAGNLLPLHAVGFHGLQAVPLVALLMIWAGAPANVAKRRIHMAGLAWAGVCLAVLWQTVEGAAPLEPSPALAAAFVCLAAWTATLGAAFRTWMGPRAAGTAH